MTVASESVASPLLSTNWKTSVWVVTMIVFVNQMLLMRAGDVERNPGPGGCSYKDTICKYTRACVYIFPFPSQSLLVLVTCAVLEVPYTQFGTSGMILD